MIDRFLVASVFTVLSIVLSAAGILILRARGWSKNWKKISKRDVVTTAYITTLITILLIAYVTTFFLING